MFPYPDDLKNDLIGTLSGDTSYQEMIRIERVYTHFLADVINQWATVEPDWIVGVHGPTVFHQGGFDSRQLVHGPLLASLLECLVVSDFRIHDILAGGQGAPLAPLYHQERFSEWAHSLAVVNIGGICNVTLIRDGQVQGFDVGPGNGLMDLICHQYFNCDYDSGGQIASQGSVIPDRLSRMLQFPFFSKPAPKSIHRDVFDESWIMNDQVQQHRPENILRTALELTVYLIVKEVKGYENIVIIGGGAHNEFLISRLKEELAVNMRLVSDADYIEAQLVAWLAIKRWQTQRLDYRQVTGAKSALLYGVMHEPFGF
jgi:anhydro-N-acetylmuramic acid kinase